MLPWRVLGKPCTLFCRCWEFQIKTAKFVRILRININNRHDVLPTWTFISDGFEVANCHIRYIKQHRWQNHWWQSQLLRHGQLILGGRGLAKGRKTLGWLWISLPWWVKWIISISSCIMLISVTWISVLVTNSRLKPVFLRPNYAVKVSSTCCHHCTINIHIIYIIYFTVSIFTIQESR